MTATAEAATPKTSRKPQDKRLSPLQLYKRRHCKSCDRHCTPTSEAFLACILCAMLDTTRRNNELAKQRGAHY